MKQKINYGLGLAQTLKYLLETGRAPEAYELSKKAILENSSNHEINLNHAIVAISVNEPIAALTHATKAFELNPKKSERAYIIIARAYILLGEYWEALKYSSKFLEISPDDDEARILMGISNSKLKFSHGALEILQKVLRKNTASKLLMAEANFYYGDTLSDIEGRTREAEKFIKKALKISPDNPNFLSGMANLLARLGKTKECHDLYDRIISLAPLNGSAYYNKSRLEKIDENQNAFRDKLKDVLSKDGLRSHDRMLLSFALGKISHDRGEVSAAASFWEQGNLIYKKIKGYHINQEKLNFAKYYHVSPRLELRDKLIKTEEQYTPIFILGMPRSGTTLTEQIIGSHSKIYPLGELEYLQRATSIAYKEFGTLDSTEALLKVRKFYFDSIEKHKLPTKFFTDKMPLNFRMIPVIVNAFPEAKIIHCDRNARAVCFSNYRNYYPADGMAFTCGQVEIAEYYRLYKDFMAFCKLAYKENYLDLGYEALTENQYENTVTLLNYCDLEFEEACLNFYKSKRAIATASQRQVKQGMYQGSSEAWKKYEPYLGPMLKTLDSYKI